MAATSPRREDDEEQRLGWRMAGIGFEVASEVAAGTILGWLFDRWQGTAPRGVLIGATIGIAVGLWSLVRNSLRLNRELDRKFPTKGRGTPIPPDEPLTPREAQPDDEDNGWNDDDNRWSKPNS
jgi:F0F1-type ATP synthase assembly protein I